MEALILRRHPDLSKSGKRVFGVIDGTHFPMHRPLNKLKENAHYNGYYAMHCTKGVFIFSPEGKIIWAFYNVKGCESDSGICWVGGLYDKLKNLTAPDCLVADSAFRGTGALKNKFLKSSCPNEGAPEDTIDAEEERKQLETENNWEILGSITQARQPSEWGMRGIKSSFPRVTRKMPVDDSKRKLIFDDIFHLINFRTEAVGLNEIRTVYMIDARRHN
jgi:hypothetical protein